MKVEQILASAVSAQEPQLVEEPVRESEVQRVVDQCDGLVASELLAVVTACQGRLAAMEGKEKSVVISATAMYGGLLGARLSSVTTVVESSAPNLVAQTVTRLVQVGSPALWAMIQEALEKPDEG